MDIPQIDNVITNRTARKAIYGVLGLLGLAASTALVVFASIHEPIPEWLTASDAALVFLGVPVGGLALSNTPSSVSTASPQAVDSPSSGAVAEAPVAPEIVAPPTSTAPATEAAASTESTPEQGSAPSSTAG